MRANFRWKRLKLRPAQLFRKKHRKTLVYGTLTEAQKKKAQGGGGGRAELSNDHVLLRFAPNPAAAARRAAEIRFKN